ncbi:hypothetical protein O181_006863 [Austropuccinia psidii MF-1]|uniref:Uncharacterized protein n=1 Tax=Austropuccinia psidii MF-1 TaxID=1389203 RepID=A0A9Q3BL13_9BASI|nr:hypothetical protein [Austropuccinia psidii MF-1]
MCEQWHTYKKKYTATKKFENLTGAGVTDEDEKKAFILWNKLKNMCPSFSDMDSLFRNKPNVKPLAIHDAQELELNLKEEELQVDAEGISPNDTNE